MAGMLGRSGVCYAINFFVAYLISIACFGLFQAIYMAKAGGAWDNAKKVVEIDPAELKGTPLHDATVIGDTVGDPFKDTSSVSMNPIIKFSTLFGLLATEIDIEMNPIAHAVNKVSEANKGASPEFLKPLIQAAIESAGKQTNYAMFVGIPFLIIAFIFVWRSFYKMGIRKED